MDIIRFISWWWKKLSEPEKGIFLIGMCIAILIPGVFFFGIKAVGYFFTALAAIFLSWLAYTSCQKLTQLWREYKAEKEREAQEIVRKLKGTK